jgi:DNA-binding transcriptional MocR family regulator
LNVPIRYHIRGKRAVEIASSIERGIGDGAIAAGNRLPTVRLLAGRLGVSVATVASAYRELRLRGLVTAAGRQGTTVARRGPVVPRGKPVFPAGVRDLANGNPDPTLLPDLKPYLSTISPDHVLYGAPPLDAELMALAAQRFAADGVKPDHLTVVSGALHGMELALMSNLRPGDRVAVEDPCYPGVSDLCASLGLAPIPVTVDDRGPLPDAMAAALRSGVSACMITPRAQNPFGSALDRERADDLAAVLRRHPDVLVIEDDHAFEITEQPGLSVCETRKVGWVQLRSVSKSLGPDLRLAIAAGDETTIARMEGRRLVGLGWVSHLLQRLVTALWSDPATSRTLTRAAAAYTERRELLRSLLQERGISSHGRSGLNVWIPVTHEDAVVNRLLESGWGVLAGERFRIAGERAIRVTTSTMDAAEAERFAADLAAAIAPVPSRLT